MNICLIHSHVNDADGVCRWSILGVGILMNTGPNVYLELRWPMCSVQDAFNTLKYQPDMLLYIQNITISREHLFLYVVWLVNINHFKWCNYVHTVTYGLGHRAAVLMEFMHACRCFPIRWIQLQMIAYSYPFDHKSVAVQSNFAFGFGMKTSVWCGYLARLQRASKGTSKSAGRRSYDIIERCSMRLDLCRIDFVVRCYFRVNTENNRFVFCRKPGSAQRPKISFNPDMWQIHNVLIHIASKFEDIACTLWFICNELRGGRSLLTYCNLRGKKNPLS